MSKIVVPRRSLLAGWRRRRAAPATVLRRQPMSASPRPPSPPPTATARPWSLAELKGKVVVLETTNHDCPYVRKHYNAGNMQTQQREAAAKGVVWLTVASSATGEEGYVTAAQANELKQKPRRSAGRRAARSAKQDRARLRRHGDAAHVHHRCQRAPWSTRAASNSIPSADIADIAKAKQYVRVGLDEVLAGKPVTDASTRPYGCSLKYPRTSSLSERHAARRLASGTTITC